MNKRYYFRLKPDCYGELGRESHVDFTRPFLQQTPFLHLHITQLLEADISVISDCWVVTEEFRKMTEDRNAQGCNYGDMYTTYDPELKKLYPEVFPPPRLWRLNPIGVPFRDDFGIDNGDLIVSDLIISILNSLHYNHCETGIEIGGINAEALIAHRRKSYW